MLREIVETVIADEPDLELVTTRAAVDDCGDLELASVDVLITGRDDPAWAAALLRRQPALRVLALIRGGKEGLLYELRPQRVALGEVSPPQLLAEIRNRRCGGAAMETARGQMR